MIKSTKEVKYGLQSFVLNYLNVKKTTNFRSCHQEYKTMLCTTDGHIIATKEDSIELNYINELLSKKKYTRYLLFY